MVSQILNGSRNSLATQLLPLATLLNVNNGLGFDINSIPPLFGTVPGVFPNFSAQPSPIESLALNLVSNLLFGEEGAQDPNTDPLASYPTVDQLNNQPAQAQPQQNAVAAPAQDGTAAQTDPANGAVANGVPVNGTALVDPTTGNPQETIAQTGLQNGELALSDAVRQELANNPDQAKAILDRELKQVAGSQDPREVINKLFNNGEEIEEGEEKNKLSAKLYDQILTNLAGTVTGRTFNTDPAIQNVEVDD